MDDYVQLSALSDEAIKDIWFSIWDLPPEERPNEDWCEAVYAVLSERGISAIHR